jgi:hypothetical protein
VAAPLPARGARSASSSLHGTLTTTLEPSISHSFASSDLSRTIIGPLVMTPAGLRNSINASSVRRVSL